MILLQTFAVTGNDIRLKNKTMEPGTIQPTVNAGNWYYGRHHEYTHRDLSGDILNGQADIRSDIGQTKSDIRESVGNHAQHLQNRLGDFEGKITGQVCDAERTLMKEICDNAKEIVAANHQNQEKTAEAKNWLTSRIDDARLWLTKGIDETRTFLSTRIDDKVLFLNEKVDRESDQIKKDLCTIRHEAAVNYERLSKQVSDCCCEMQLMQKDAEISRLKDQNLALQTQSTTDGLLNRLADLLVKK